MRYWYSWLILTKTQDCLWYDSAYDSIYSDLMKKIDQFRDPKSPNLINVAGYDPTLGEIRFAFYEYSESMSIGIWVESQPSIPLLSGDHILELLNAMGDAKPV